MEKLKLTGMREAFEEHVRKNPGKEAVIFRNEVWTYSRLDREIGKLTRFLPDRETGEEKVIAILMDRSPLNIALFLAVHRAGHSYIPLDPTHPSDRINTILNIAEPDYIITQKKYTDICGNRDDIIYTEDLEGISYESMAPDSASNAVDPETTAYMIYTSGSTGIPKGVMIPHRALDNLLESMSASPGLNENDRLLAITTYSFDLSIPDVYLPLYSGATMIILEKNDARDPGEIIRNLDLHDCTFMQATPATWQMMIDFGWEGKENLKALCGGEALSQDLAEMLIPRCSELWNMYGPTETTVWSMQKKIEDHRAVTLGAPIRNTDIFILDEKREPVAKGEIGELYIGGAGLAKGYNKRPDLTEKAFLPYGSGGSGRIYKTGDLVRLTENNDIVYIGRSDFQVKIRGFRIELEEIERHLINMEGIDKVLVHAVGSEGNKELVAYVIPDEGEISHKEVRRFLSEHLPEYMIPTHTINLEIFPLNPNGKIDRKQLPLPQSNPSSHQLPADFDAMDRESQLTAIFRKILRAPAIDRESDFFEAGGNSILAVQLVGEINRLCGTELSLGVFFRNPSPGKLTDVLSDARQSEEIMVIPLREQGTESPLFCLVGIDLYSDLALNLDGDRPVYGVFLPWEQKLIEDIKRGTVNFSDILTINSMAEEYVREIRNVQETGPYNLLGVSMAGIIAFEVARQLKALGEEIGNLIILDTHLPSGIIRDWKFKLINFARNLKGNLPKTDSRFEADENPEHIALLRDEMNDRATLLYDQSNYKLDGSACLVKAEITDYPKGISYRPDLGWGNKIQGNLTIHTVPGDHLGILEEPNVRILAEKVSSYMRESR
ncbi:MAG: amino acid adenylation domain-containing protein [Spirochaetales bacterium]|nr:amino acid adenylation domain-containing protein [Spirochaetales bacterium]